VEPSGLDAFASESGASHSIADPSKADSAASRTRSGARREVWITIGAGLLIGTFGAGAYGTARRWIPGEAPGSVAFETEPSGIDVTVAGRTLGSSPLTASLPAGTYDVRLGTGPGVRTFTLTVTSGASIVQHYEMAPGAPENGTLTVQTEPARQAVLVDGVNRGMSPLTLEHVSPGNHEIASGAERAGSKHTVRVTAGQTTSAILTSSQPADGALVTGGWLSVTSPITLEVRERGRLLGTTDVDRLMMPSGEHDIELVNDRLGVRLQQTVKIVAGRTVVLKAGVSSGR